MKRCNLIRRKRILSFTMVMFFCVFTFLTSIGIPVKAQTRILSIINSSDTENEYNKFSYVGDGWRSGATTDSYNGDGDEHFNVVNVGDTNFNEKYYTITFIGNKIEVYGHKSWNHGIVSYSVDGGEEVEVSSYAPSRKGNQLLFMKEGLTEGVHTIVAKATGKTEASNGSAAIQVDYAKVYHEPYVIEDITIENNEIDLMVGMNHSIKYSIIPSYAQALDLTFESKNNEIATVDSNGIINGISEGQTEIIMKAQSDTIEKVIVVNVEKAIPGIKGSIVDTNTHYNQDKYDEVKNKGIKNKDLFAWKADKAISEIAIVSDNSKLENVNVEISDFISGNNVLESSNIKTTFLKETLAYTGDAGYHNQNDISMPQGPKELVPDILYGDEPVNIGFNKVQPIWVEFNTPADIKAGIYSGTIKVTADNIERPLEFNYNLEILDAVMPDSMSYDFDIELWQYPYSSAEYYNVEPFSQEHLEILTPHMLKYKELGGKAITTSIVEEAWGGQTYSSKDIRYPSMVKWTKELDGTYSFDFTAFDKWVEFNKELGIGSKIICYSMIPWGNRIYYFDKATQMQQSIVVNPGTTTYEGLWTQFLNKLIPHLDEKGWFEETYIGIDERANMDKAFDVIDKVKNKDGLILKKAAAMDHFNESYLNITERVDDLSVGSTAAKGNLSAYKDFVEKRNNSEKDYKTTVYTCTEHFPNSLALSMPGESYWTMMFAAAQGATGYMRWAYDAWVNNPLEDVTHWAFEAGDTSMIYPDERDASNPVSKSSVRLEKMAEGMRDVNKLYLMAKEIPLLESDIKTLLESVNVNYEGRKNGIGEHGGAKFATDRTREMLPTDMENIRLEIKNITNKYIELKENGVQHIESVDIQQKELELVMGKTDNLNVVVLPENTLNNRVKFSSTDESIASVDKKGQVKAISKGVTTIIATSLQDVTKKDEIKVTVVEEDLSNNMIAYYNFESIQNNIVEDKFGEYNGVLHGGNIIDGVVGSALEFKNGVDSVIIDNPTTINENWTIAMWAKKGDITNLPASIMWDGKEFQNGDKQTESLDIQRDSSGNMGVSVKQGFLTIKHNLQKDKWVHLAFVNDKEKGLTLYVNGITTGTNAWTKNNQFSAPLKVIGGRNYIGSIDEVKVFDKPLVKSEIDEIRKIPGLNLNTENIEIMEGENFKLQAELISDANDKTIEFVVDNPKIASVDSEGTVLGKAYGDTFITVSNKESGFSKKVNVRINKNMNIGYTIPQYDYEKDKQIVIDREEGQYLGQPDMIVLDDDKTLLTVYPKGHGYGPTVLKKSTDGGISWSDRLETNETWKDSMETPTLYKLNMTDGTTKLIQISGGPGWGNGFKGWTTSISNDNGESWSDYKKWHEGNTTIVAMASLIQLKNENGEYIDKWMGVYHDYGYVNYKTYLTFDENGNEQWSSPTPYLSEWRDIEKSVQLCEVGMFRSPDGKQIAMLARSQSHKNKSTIAFSNDEGETWSKPREVQGALNGERHKISYDPISGRLLVTFREIILDYNKNGIIEDGDWMAGDWIAWVGTYNDLVNGNEGQYRIRLAEDFTRSAKSGDCGYAGNIVLNDGTFVLNSYGNFDENDTSNKPYIIGVRFKLGEIDNMLGLVDKTELIEEIEKSNDLDNKQYTSESWDKYSKVLNLAKMIAERTDIQQIEIDDILEQLKSAFNELEFIKEIKVSKINNLQVKDITNNSINLVWDEPKYTIGLIEYEIYKDGKIFKTISKDETEITVDLLKSNCIYSFKVIAKYSNGKSSGPVTKSVRTLK